MKNRRKNSEYLKALWTMLVIAMLMLLTGCGEELVPYPFKDGDYFIYQRRPELTDVTMSYIFRVESLDDGFVVRRFQAAETPSGEKAETRLEHSEKVYDRYGRLLRLADGRSGGRCQGNFCFLWLPPSKREVGAEVKLSEAAATLTVTESLTRDYREVLVIQYGNSVYYYDKLTGLLVERKALGKLVDTNRKDLL